MKKLVVFGVEYVKMTKAREVKKVLKNSEFQEKEGESAGFLPLEKRQVSFGRKYFGHYL